MGFQDFLGTVVEDRGFLSSGGRRLLRLKVEFDSPNVVVIEVPEDELAPVD
jgi:hypothetical protein